jgi:excisionase family DNA binding protein
LLLSLAEAAALLGISRTLCWELCRQQQLPNVRLGRKRLLIPRAALQSFVDEQTRTAIANTAIAKDAADPMSPRPLAS